MSNPTDINTFTPIQTFTPAANTDWQEATINLAGSTATGRYVTLRSTGSTSYVDDFGMYWSDCMYPSKMEVSGMTTNSVQVSWSSTGVSSYDFSYKLPGDASWTDMFGLTDTSYTITGLDDATSYTEASATAGFAYGILLGIERGMLPPVYKKAADRAVKAILGLITDEGVVEQVSYGTPMGRTDKDFYKNIEIKPMPYGQALAILLLMEYRKFC